MEKGVWDSAFKDNGYKASAFDLPDTPFGNATYVGNHMLDVDPNMKMKDAYDGLIFFETNRNIYSGRKTGGRLHERI